MRLSPNEKVRMSLARSTDANDTCRKIIDSEKRGLDMTFQYLDMESFMQIVYRLNHARRIFVVGHHLTRIVADFFLYQLKRIGREAHLVDTSDKKKTCDRLLHATKEDVFGSGLMCCYDSFNWHSIFGRPRSQASPSQTA